MQSVSIAVKSANTQSGSSAVICRKIGMFRTATINNNSTDAATEPKAALPFELPPADLKNARLAEFAVKGWHTETFSAAVMANSPEIFRFALPAAAREAENVFGTDSGFLNILDDPSLPDSKNLRR